MEICETILTNFVRIIIQFFPFIIASMGIFFLSLLFMFEYYENKHNFKEL